MARISFSSVSTDLIIGSARLMRCYPPPRLHKPVLVGRPAGYQPLAAGGLKTVSDSRRIPGATMSVSIAAQNTTELGGGASILRLQRRDHIKLDHLLDELHSATGPAQDEVLTTLGRLVFPHAFAEESVIWPLARRVLPDGEALTLQVEREHQQINEMWTRLETTPLDHPDRASLLEGITTLLRQDVRDEEDELLPRLQERLSAADLRRAGRSWQAVRAIAPTRPHPVVSRRPPGNVVAALPLTILDRGRDRLDQLARRAVASERRAFQTLSTAATRGSQRMARLAGLVENAPVMTRGEDPSTAADAS
jgi:Hemerythrin HHE cation binding domain